MTANAKGNPGGMQTKRIPKPIRRSKLARRYRMTRSAERERQHQNVVTRARGKGRYFL
jgi:hypothetical protein